MAASNFRLRNVGERLKAMCLLAGHAGRLEGGGVGGLLRLGVGRNNLAGFSAYASRVGRIGPIVAPLIRK